MLKINNPFYMEYPVIDLHGLDKVSALMIILNLEIIIY